MLAPALLAPAGAVAPALAAQFDGGVAAAVLVLVLAALVAHEAPR